MSGKKKEEEREGSENSYNVRARNCLWMRVNCERRSTYCRDLSPFDDSCERKDKREESVYDIHSNEIKKMMKYLLAQSNEGHQD